MVPIRHVLSSKWMSMLLSIVSYHDQKWDVNFNKRISSLFSRQSLFIKVNLKWPLSRNSPFKIHFYLEWQGNRGSIPSFHAFPLSKDHKLINPNYEIYNKVTCMVIPSREKYHNNLLYMFRYYLVIIFVYKNKIKITPIERQSP